MKITNKIACLLITFASLASISEGNSVYEESISNFSEDPSPENLMRLARHLRGIARYHVDYKESEYYQRIQDLLLRTPGHARYFADEVERLIADPKNAGSSVRERSWYLRQTLVHLPSPETIQVLGSYLYDERFSLDPTVVNSGATGPTYALVAVALRHIGLRETEDYIRTQGTRWTTEEDIESIRRWWEEVKTGERTFSFKGQGVEYRFLPDGTWETILIANPPDDGPGASEAKPAPANARESPAQLAVPADNESGVPWRWIWIGVAGLLFAGYLGLRKFRKGGR